MDWENLVLVKSCAIEDDDSAHRKMQVIHSYPKLLERECLLVIKSCAIEAMKLMTAPIEKCKLYIAINYHSNIVNVHEVWFHVLDINARLCLINL